MHSHPQRTTERHKASEPAAPTRREVQAAPAAPSRFQILLSRATARKGQFALSQPGAIGTSPRARREGIRGAAVITVRGRISTGVRPLLLWLTKCRAVKGTEAKSRTRTAEESSPHLRSRRRARLDPSGARLSF